MRTIEHTLLKFEELSDEHKAKVIEHHRDWNVDGLDWWDGVYEDAERMGALMGIDINNIYFSGFWSQGDGACFESTFSFVKGIAKNVKNEAPLDEELNRIAKEIQDLHRRTFYCAYGNTKQRGHYYHSGCMDVDVEIERGDFDEDGWNEVMRDFANWIYKNLEKEHEFLTSDEMVAESLACNEMEFELDEEGDLIL